MTEISIALAPAKERLIKTAYDLFARRGVRGVGVDEIIATSNVAKATFYKYFRSKDELVLAFLARRDELWTRAVVEEGARSRSDHPEGQLLAIFDVYDDWFSRPAEFEACSFVNVMLEMGPQHPLGQAAVGYLEDIRSVVRGLATEAGLREPEEFARSWHILMKGSIVSAAEGDLKAAIRAKAMARTLIEQFRGPEAPLG